MEQVKSIIQKIDKIIGAGSPANIVEKELLLRHTLSLYEAIQSLEIHTGIAQEKIKEFPVQKEQAAAVVVSEPEPSVKVQMEEQQSMHAEKTAPVAKQSPAPVVEAIVQKPLKKEMAMDNFPDVFPAEKMSFDLEPELKEEMRLDHQNKKGTEFKVWNKDIRMYIGINDRYNFISELFKNNAEAYDEVLNEINHANSKEAALLFLENSGITTLYDWDKEGFSAQIFYSILNQFFSAT